MVYLIIIVVTIYISSGVQFGFWRLLKWCAQMMCWFFPLRLFQDHAATSLQNMVGIGDHHQIAQLFRSIRIYKSRAMDDAQKTWFSPCWCNPWMSGFIDNPLISKEKNIPRKHRDVADKNWGANHQIGRGWIWAASLVGFSQETGIVTMAKMC